MTDSSNVFNESWQADWASQRIHKLTAGLAVTPAERLAWLEEAILFAHAAGALPRSKVQLSVRGDASARRNQLDTADEAAQSTHESPTEGINMLSTRMPSQTSSRLLEPDAVPYFLWDTRQTVGEARTILAGPANSDRDEILVRLLREANSRDVWLFTNWLQIDEAWPRIVHRLGRARPVWELLRERHLYHVRAAS